MANSKKIPICLGVDFESKPILIEDGLDALYKAGIVHWVNARAERCE